MFRVRIDTIAVECDTVDEVRQLVGALQLPFVQAPAPSYGGKYVSSTPVNDMMNVAPAAAVSQRTPRVAKRQKSGRRQDAVRIFRQTLLAAIPHPPGSVHRRTLVATYGHRTDRYLGMLVDAGQVRRVAVDGHPGFYAAVQNGHAAAHEAVQE